MGTCPLDLKPSDFRNWHDPDGQRGQSTPALPSRSDVNLFRYCERVVYLYSEIAHGALDFRMAKQ